MAFYRHKPKLERRQKIGITSAVLGLLLLPAFINVLLPQVNTESSPVILGGTGWEIPLVDDKQEPIECVHIPTLSVTKQWDCWDFVIETTVLENGDNPKMTLQRAYRAFSPANVYPEDAQVEVDGQFYSLTFDGYSAVTFNGTGENEGQSIFVFFIGNNQNNVLELVKGSLI